MLTRFLRRFFPGAVISLVATSILTAQQAVTITGHVSAANLPVRGATVRIDTLNIGATTDAEGRYSFIIPSTRVRGQGVALTARYPRYRPQSVQIVLTGGALLRDFELVADNGSVTPPGGATSPAPSGLPRVSGGLPDASRAGTITEQGTLRQLSTKPRASGAIVDSSIFIDVAGAADVPSALAGRVAGLNVESSSAVGGTTKLLIRGEHSVSGVTQPLVVIDGIIADNSNVTSLLQRYGQGGFDYGTTLSDFNPEDIGSVQVLKGPEATARYGGRAANGVLIITTRNARGLNGFTVAANQQFTAASIIARPSYQNSYGQGLAGKFAFFDGKGGGVNDATDQSWGPLLDGSAVPQASLSEVARAEVRPWIARPSNVSDFFTSANALSTNVSMQGGNESGHLRGAIDNRLLQGNTPQSKVTRRSVVLNGDVASGTRFSLEGSAQYYNEQGEDRPGSGFDESNTVSTFSHTPRQIDIAAYMTRQKDATGAQLSWNYSGRNNPWFNTISNDNHDERSRYLAGGTAALALSDVLTVSVRGGADHSSEQRQFLVASGWMSGYPDYFGRGDFSTGGSESDDLSRTAVNADVWLRASPRSPGPLALAFSVGAATRINNLTTNISVTDRTGGSPSAANWTGNSTAQAVFGSVDAGIRDAFAISASVREENLSLGSGASASTLYPALLASLDLTRLDSGSRRGTLSSFIVRGGWSRSGNAGTGDFLQRLGFNSSSTAAQLQQVIDPELTTALEAGVSARAFSNRLGADVTVYSDKSDNLVLPIAGGYSRTTSLTNTGVEVGVDITSIPLSRALALDVRATFARNTNTVNSIAGGSASFALAPSFGGVTVVAQPGAPLGTLLGFRYLRDATGGLLLRDGHPLPDSVAGPVNLGQGAPSWIAGLSGNLTYRGFMLSALLDVHHGGQIFSASNRAGAVSGVLAETSFRPDSGLLIAGTDAATGQANTKHVSTEDYYHALGGIAQRWVYDGSFVKLRDARVTYTLPLQAISVLRAQSARFSVIGRNLSLWTSVPNIDPETVLSTATYRGTEMGQLPTVRSLGVQLSITP